MAYFLDFNASNETCVSNQKVELSGHFRIDVDMRIKSFPSLQKLFDGSGAINNQRLDITIRETGADNRNYCHFLVDGSPAGDLSGILGQRVIFGLERNATDSDQSLKEFSFIGCRFNQQAGQFLDAEVYGIKVYNSSGVLIHNFNKQTLNGANDTVYPDTVGGNDGTLVNFPTDNSQWVFFDDGGGAVTANVTETSDSATESSGISITANITAQITETYSDATESSTASITTLVTASVTELSQDATESSAATITNNLVTLNVTEIAQDFTESVSATVAGKVSALVTELSADSSESSTLPISANISAVVTEIAQDFADNIGVNVVGSFTVEVTETTTDFDEACYLQLPVQRLVARKTISVGARSGKISVNSKRSGTIRVTRRNHIIRVK